MLHHAHMACLSRAAAALRAAGDVPDFDPLDGGAAADLLLLLEKPGPTTLAGSALVSRDNDTATAEAIARFAAVAGLDRTRTVLWNAVPWWNGTIRVTGREVTAGQGALPGVLACLPRVRAAITAGRTAARARVLLESHGLAVFASAHPSPNVRAGHPALWRAIPDRWAEARAFLNALPGQVCPAPRDGR